jgi:N-acetylneuraminate synthase
MKIGNRQIGDGASCYIIAEAGVNHCGEIDIARCMIDAAKQAGADAVKFQLYYPDKTISKFCPQAEYARRAGMTESHKDMTARLMLAVKDYRRLKNHCDDIGIEFLCTGFDETAINALYVMGVRALKIPSGEINNLTYLRYAAYYQLPIILSTGMSELWEVEQAIRAIVSRGNHDIALLHCVSNYPAAPEDCNLHAMKAMRNEFGYPVGFSDHTEGNEVALAAVALGACIIEKHFTLDKSLPGPDHQASCTPDEFAALVEGIRKVEKSLSGDGVKRMMESERNTRDVARKSVVAARDIQEGETFTRDNLTVKRPGTGLSPYMLDKLIGHKVTSRIEADVIIARKMVK